MPYVKQTWQTGDVVTSAKLNHMEDGIAAGGGGGGGGVFSMTATHNEDTNSFVLDKTAGEILNAFKAKQCPVAFFFQDDDNISILPFDGFSYFEGFYHFWSDDGSGNDADFNATSLSEYPAWAAPKPPGG